MHSAPTPTTDQDPYADITLIDADTLVELWGVRKEWIHDMVEKGRLPAVKLGHRTTRFHVPTLRAWIAKNTIVKIETKPEVIERAA